MAGVWRGCCRRGWVGRAGGSVDGADAAAGKRRCVQCLGWAAELTKELVRGATGRLALYRSAESDEGWVLTSV